MPDPGWQKSSFSGGEPNTECVELARGGTGARVTLFLRESEHPDAVLVGSTAAFRALLIRLKAVRAP
ncbi:DUF397 domain-containing protein [Streptomyces boncukensis]|uniref:DUF397 domain-containing protein n=1 Tax=Streptomyces boncukensis TaxID=2711219 RepID=A0A6G4WYK1_9ACTN|nr:DUF397 domain-containing protein [Streptomyces boncukensis]NGO70315.1 DUF397 domain-containing protein [Streptomyces boncukensis]